MDPLTLRRRSTGMLILIALLATSCSPTWLDSLLPNQPASDPPAALVEVTFYVQLPLNTPDDQQIFLSTLDEVTGLGVNAQAHPLEPAISEEDLDQGLLYKTTLAVPQQATLKYRYTRQNQYAVIEHTSTNEQVRYRMVQADTPLEVRDVVYAWSDTDYYWSEPGRISGTITDSTTGEPIPGVLVTAGGVQTHTTANGSYLLSGLPPGVHNLVAYSIDGSYQVLQQGAEVASQANTEANLALEPREFVDVTFLVTVPYGTPEKGVRLAGNLYQLGNTFGNLSGGMNTIPDRMPSLLHAGDNRYGIILSLPVGAEIRYKYTLGDGFWNAEHTEDGSFRVRRMIVPPEPVEINDTVATWSSGSKQAITFDLYTPENTPENEHVYIQFNPYGWTTPLPMMQVDPHHWAFILYSPFDIISDLTYRYCREGDCGNTDDLESSGDLAAGRSVEPAGDPQYIADTVENWAWLEENLAAGQADTAGINPRGGKFLTAVEIMPGDAPGHTLQVIDALPDIAALQSDWVMLTPTWSFTHQRPPVLQPDPNQDPLWFDLSAAVEAAGSQNLQAALHPQVHFPETATAWWGSAPRDFAWWNSWFDQYAAYAAHFAVTAEQLGVETLVLGGEWLEPALPGGKLADGKPSGVPADAGMRWEKILSEVREQYSGRIAWAMALPEQDTPPQFFKHIDQIQLTFNPDLTPSDGSESENASQTAGTYLDSAVKPFQEDWLQPDGKELVLRINYPSAAGGSSACIPGGGEDCLARSNFFQPAPDFPGIEADFNDQAAAYQAVFQAAASREWISGLISQGYYAPAVLHDLSISIHGKPAESIVQQWFSALTP